MPSVDLNFFVKKLSALKLLYFYEGYRAMIKYALLILWLSFVEYDCSYTFCT